MEEPSFTKQHAEKKEKLRSRSISFSVEERSTIQIAADRQGVTFTAYVRGAALNAADFLLKSNSVT